MTTTLVPSGAKFHRAIASARRWRMQPCDCGVPSWARVCTGRPFVDRDVVEADGGVRSALGEAHEVLHGRRSRRRPGPRGARVDPVGARVEVVGQAARDQVGARRPASSASTSQTRWRLWLKTTRRAARRSRPAARRPRAGRAARRRAAAVPARAGGVGWAGAGGRRRLAAGVALARGGRRGAAAVPALRRPEAARRAPPSTATTVTASDADERRDPAVARPDLAAVGSSAHRCRRPARRRWRSARARSTRFAATSR